MNVWVAVMIPGCEFLSDAPFSVFVSRTQSLKVKGHAKVSNFESVSREITTIAMRFSQNRQHSGSFG